MCRTGTVLTSLLAFCVLAAGAGAPVPRYDLTRVARVDSFAGSAAARRLLEQNGFVVAEPQFRQVFEAYIRGGAPKFVTTDSAWHTYHVLLEEGVRQLEMVQASSLRQFSSRLMKTACAKSGGSPGPYRDLAVFAAVGLCLQDAGAPAGLEPSLSDEARRTIEVVSAGGRPHVLFFGLPFPAARLQPQSFYADSPLLQGYFAARTWYALCAFRLNADEETERAVGLALLVKADPDLEQLWEQLTVPYDTLLGGPEDGDVRTYASLAAQLWGEQADDADVAAGLARFRELALARLPEPRVNDQLLAFEQYMNAAGELAFADEIRGFRLLPPRHLPSADLFQRTVDPVVEGRPFPSGVDLLAAGPFASEAGRRALEGTELPATARQAILSTERCPLPDSLHGRALALLATLQDPLPDAAPAPLRGPAWHDKQAWTQLSAWAEQRHTFALHARLAVTYLLLPGEPPGFVSPYPAFFDGLAELAGDTADALRPSSRAAALDTAAAGRTLLEFVELARAIESDEDWTPAPDQRAVLTEAQLFVDAFLWWRRHGTFEQETTAIIALEGLGKKCVLGGPLHPNELGVLEKVRRPPRDVPALLGSFASLCRALAGIARKELDGHALTEGDARVIGRYGELLAQFHFYESNSWLEPRDDFPLAVPVYENPLLGQVLYAALPRPEAVYVVIESGGRPTLHLGAVLGYREFLEPADAPLTDAVWRERVLAGRVPPPPAFTRSFRAVADEAEAAATGEAQP